MNSDLKHAQSVMGVEEGRGAVSIYCGSDADQATKAYTAIARVGKHPKFRSLIWYGNGRLIKKCGLKKEEIITQPIQTDKE